MSKMKGGLRRKGEGGEERTGDKSGGRADGEESGEWRDGEGREEGRDSSELERYEERGVQDSNQTRSLRPDSRITPLLKAHGEVLPNREQGADKMGGYNPNNVYTTPHHTTRVFFFLFLTHVLYARIWRAHTNIQRACAIIHHSVAMRRTHACTHA
jgi:hypothetical protein